MIRFKTTYKTAGTAKVRGSRTRHQLLWVGLWVGLEQNGYAPGASSHSPAPLVFGVRAAPPSISEKLDLAPDSTRANSRGRNY